jgi:hypothetical protein
VVVSRDVRAPRDIVLRRGLCVPRDMHPSAADGRVTGDVTGSWRVPRARRPSRGRAGRRAGGRDAGRRGAQRRMMNPNKASADGRVYQASPLLA